MEGRTDTDFPANPIKNDGYRLPSTILYRSIKTQFGPIYYYPALFGLYPIFSLWLANYDVISAADVHRASIVTLFTMVGAGLILRLVRLSMGQVAAMISLTAAMFFTYGHSLLGLAKWHTKGILFPTPVTFTMIYLIIWILGVCAAIRWMKQDSPIHSFLNITSTILTVFVLIQIVVNEISFAKLVSTGLFQKHDITCQMKDLQPPDILPDVYYIILDSYAGEEAMLKYLEFDNSDFYQQLEKRGFYLAESSTSNYANTAPSLASILNFQYLDPIVEAVGNDSGDYRPLREYIQNNQAMNFFDRYYYSTVAFDTGFNITEIKDADYYIRVQNGPNNFESLLLSNSIAKLWINETLAVQYRNRIPGVLMRIGQLSDIPSPKFVFAHVMAAHAPYVFGKNGEVRNSATRVTRDEGGSAEGNLEEREAYKNQVLYVNQLTLVMVDSILRNSIEDPVIVIQGDHGAGIYMDGESTEDTCFIERKSILNAFYFPGRRNEQLYPTITPVNSFRVIFNTFFGADLPLLEDRNYFSLFKSPYLMIDVTDRAGKCP